MSSDKTPVVGMLQRDGDVKAFVATVTNSKKLMSLVRKNVKLGESVLMTDEYRAYSPMKKIVPHFSVNHSKHYVDGIIHTNSIEGFWALLKRGIVGQYHRVSLKYLQKYINEFSFRYNNRKNENIFNEVLLRSVGV